jgi:hypothetical protein
MSRIRVGIIRYSSVADRIAAALSIDHPPEVRIGVRTRIVFRTLGATRWPEQQQVEYALQVADIARGAIAADSRRRVRRRTQSNAIVVVFEDATVKRGCSIVARWECVVPAPGAVS